MTAEPTTPGRRSARVPWTLMYHSVGDSRNDPYLITVDPGRLAAQLRWLNRHGLTGVGMRELLAARAAGRDQGLVGLTFDDGYADFLHLAVPALREHGHTATVFVLAGRLGGTNAWDPDGPVKQLLDAQGIREAAGAGMEIGSHGLLHRDLTELDDAALAAEVGESRELLAEVTGTAPIGFCYPYGTVDARVIAAVRRAGYTYACAITPGPLTSLLALPRTHIGNRETAPRLHAKRALHDFHSRRLPALPDLPAAALAGSPRPPETGPSPARTPPYGEVAHHRSGDHPADADTRSAGHPAPAAPSADDTPRPERGRTTGSPAGQDAPGPQAPAPLTDSPGGHP